MDLFEAPSQFSGVKKTTYIDYRPLAVPQHGCPVEFHIQGNSPHYIDLRRTRLLAKWHLAENNGDTLAAEATVVNLAHHAMWSDIQLSLQHKTLHSVGVLYPYKAYLETLLTTSEDCKKSQLTSEFWYSDSPYTFNRLDQGIPQTDSSDRPQTESGNRQPQGDKDTSARSGRASGDSSKTARDTSTVKDFVNEGYLQRYKLTAGGALCDTAGPLLLDLCQQSRPIINGVDIHVKLWPAKDTFVIMTERANKVKLVLDDITLRVCKLEIDEETRKEHESRLRHTPSKYPMQKTVMKTYTLPHDIFQINIEDMYQGLVPNQLIVGIVNSASFDGDYARNPFEFQHNNATSAAFYVDGESVPGPPMICDFRTKHQTFTNVYDALFSVINQDRCDFGNGISQSDFRGGTTLFAFKIADSTKRSAKGHTRLVIQLKDKLKQTAILVTYATFPSMLEIDSHRNIKEE